MIMSPSLTITEAEIDALMRILRASLDATAKDLGVG
jgi:adenosylmethionine-8-amino-7-oxononanoate aminotransferase